MASFCKDRVGIIVDHDAVRSPQEHDGDWRVQQYSNRGLQALRPPRDRPQPRVGPVAETDECAHLAPAERKAIVVPGTCHLFVETRPKRILYREGPLAYKCENSRLLISIGPFIAVALPASGFRSTADLQVRPWHFSTHPFAEVQGTARKEVHVAVSLDDKDAIGAVDLFTGSAQ
jgi:hypothetical protein